LIKKSFPYKREISKEDIAKLNPFSYRNNINVIDSKAKLDKLKINLDKKEIIGFDTETRPSFKKGVSYPCALVQVALPDEVLLFRLNNIGFPQILIDILADESLNKIGIAIHDDILQLNKIEPFESRSFIDLNVICPKIGFESIGAKKLSALVLGIQISKRQQVSNWEAQVLSDAQIRYAATDAWICREIYLKLEAQKLISPDLI
jgi:ribonuclease D